MTDELRFEVATKKHAKDIQEFMLADFGTTEPITQALSSHNLGATSADLSDFYLDFAESGCSHEKYSTIVYKNDRLIAVCLSSLKKFNEEDELPPEIDAETHDFAHDISNGPYKQHKANQIFIYVAALEHRERQLLGRNSKVLKLDILSVSKDYRGRGLGKDLTRRAIETARAEGCDWVAASATAAASQGILLKMGFQVLYEIPFSAYRENGSQVFRNLYDGCTSGKFMALRLK